MARLPPTPDGLKDVIGFALNTATKFDKQFPLVAYYCRYRLLHVYISTRQSDLHLWNAVETTAIHSNLLFPSLP